MIIIIPKEYNDIIDITYKIYGLFNDKLQIKIYAYIGTRR